MGGESTPVLSKFWLIVLLTFVLGACSSGSSSGSSDEVVSDTPPPTTPPPSSDPDPDPDPDPGAEDPTVQLSANDSIVSNGGMPILTWSSTNADTCSASGGWSGAKALQGQETVGPLNTTTTFTLACDGPGGRATMMVSVAVLEALTISWQAPTEDVDGSPVDPLDYYRIFYGTSPGDYDDVAEVTASLSSHTFEVVEGSYYVAMTAVNTDGEESALSAEVLLASQ